MEVLRAGRCWGLQAWAAHTIVAPELHTVWLFWTTTLGLTTIQNLHYDVQGGAGDCLPGESARGGARHSARHDRRRPHLGQQALARWEGFEISAAGALLLHSFCRPAFAAAEVRGIMSTSNVWDCYATRNRHEDGSYTFQHDFVPLALHLPASADTAAVLCADARFADQGVRYACIAGCSVRGNMRADRRALSRYRLPPECQSYAGLCRNLNRCGDKVMPGTSSIHQGSASRCTFSCSC